METKGGGTGKVLKMLPGIVGNQLAIMFYYGSLIAGTGKILYTSKKIIIG